MRFMSTTFRRKAISTILGTLIFISILFTAVIPMFLTMNQADVMLEQAKITAENLDVARAGESLMVVAFPSQIDSQELTIKVDNTGEYETRILRIWIGNSYYETDTSLTIGETQLLGPFNVNPHSGQSYQILAVTERGNRFPCSIGSLQYENGQWVTPTLGIYINIMNFIGKFKILYTNATHTDVLSYETKGIDVGNVVHIISVSYPGTYYVTVKVKQGGSWINLPGSPITVVLQWPNGSPIVNVFVENPY